MTEYIKNVAIVGGSGRIGTAILNALLATNCFNITAISRANSKPTFPSTVTVKKGHYSNSDFLVSVLQGQDAFIYVLGIGTPYETAMALADAAIAAKVPWVLPNEYGSDNLHPLMGGGQGFVVRDKVDGFEKLQNSDCNVVAYVNGCWYDYSLGTGSWGIDVRARKATIYGNGNVKACTTTVATAGQGVANLLSLPIATSDDSPCLSDYKNKQCFVAGLRVTQRDILDAVQRATSTSDKDWTLDQRPVDDVIAQGNEGLAKGDFSAFVYILYGLQFKPGSGSDFSDRIANTALKLKSDDLDEATKVAVKDIEAGLYDRH